jgi:hypothetical protein
MIALAGNAIAGELIERILRHGGTLGEVSVSVAGHLPSREVLPEPLAVCSSQDFDSLLRSGTGLGDRSSGCRSPRQTRKKAVCWPLVKPSDGLEPSTPSLQWRGSTN